MTDIVSAPAYIQIEEVQNKAAVSEATASKIGSSVNYILDNGIEPLGTITQSILTEAQFQALKGTKWVRMSGQSIAGSDLDTLTGITTLPDMTGNEAFLGSTDLAESTLANYEANQNKAHTHKMVRDTTSASTIGTNDQIAADGDDGGTVADYKLKGSTSGTLRGTTTSEGGTVARPNTYRVSFFIKINNV